MVGGKSPLKVLLVVVVLLLVLAVALPLLFDVVATIVCCFLIVVVAVALLLLFGILTSLPFEKFKKHSKVEYYKDYTAENVQEEFNRDNQP